jgi:predicted Zn-dependent peptidase
MAQNNPLSVKEIKLKNGFTVWVNEDHTQPKVYGAVVVNAGAKDSPNTGIAHYFEHIMFKGTEKIGTTDYAAEKVYLDSIKVKYDELAATVDATKRKEIQLQINELSIKSADYAIPNEFERLITRFGGTGMNAFTSNDKTVYFNSFSPQYLAHWAEVNSERFLDPVFRLFQGELETVYEEKNMRADRMGGMTAEKVLERFFQPHPYAFPIVGSTENLKNPRLSEMEKFFNDYYVAGNMCLILAGDVNVAAVLPLMEKTFGRIRSGTAPKVKNLAPPAFNGVEKSQVKFPMPIVKMRGLGWRGVPENDPDELKLLVFASLLNNSNSTGYLDKLVSDSKLMAVQSLCGSFNEAGVWGVLIVPKLLFQSANKAETLVIQQIDRIKNGDFTEEMLDEVKLEHKRQNEQKMEELQDRGLKMVSLFTQGRTWDDYLAQIQQIDKISKQDIVEVANKYLTNNYLQLDKKTGDYPKEKVEKPSFKPVVPKNSEAKSDYAAAMEKMEVSDKKPRFIDFQNDVEFTELTPLVNFYAVKNPMNDVFTVTFSFEKGEFQSKKAELTGRYINLLGTDSLAFEQLRGKLQKLGSTMEFSSSDNAFLLNISGFDKNLPPTLELVGYFLKNVKGDSKKLKQIVDDEKVSRKTLTKEPRTVAKMMLDKVAFGEKSRYLNWLSVEEVKKIKSEELIAEFENLLKTECNIHYCGNLPVEQVQSEIRRNFDLQNVTNKSNPVFRKYLPVSENTVYLLEYKDVTQSVIYNYIQGNPNTDAKERSTISVFNNYFGGNMRSIIFQEVREFRSLAYTAQAVYHKNSERYRNENGALYTFLTTQSDKTATAMRLVDSLLKNMPMKSERVNMAKQDVTNETHNNFPTFRKISSQIASLKQDGYSADPHIEIMEALPTIEIADIERFYQNNIQGKPMAWIIVGNPNTADLQEIGKCGKVVKLKWKDILK